jgi:hypothetical protein
MGFGVGVFLIVAMVMIIVYAIRRSLEGAAYRSAITLATQGQPVESLRKLIDAESRWGFNTAHDVMSTRLAALERLQSMVHLAYEQTQLIGRPIDVREVVAMIQQCQQLFGTKEHYSWGSNATLKSQYRGYVSPMVMQLHAARRRFITQVQAAIGR